MSEKPIKKVLGWVDEFKRRGEEYRTKCLAHNGTSEDSLSIKEADNGDVLLHCHAGCESEEIVEAFGLYVADLFAKNGRSSHSDPPRADRPAETISVDELPGVESGYYTFEDPEGNLLYIQRHKGAYSFNGTRAPTTGWSVSTRTGTPYWPRA